MWVPPAAAEQAERTAAEPKRRPSTMAAPNDPRPGAPHRAPRLAWAFTTGQSIAALGDRGGRLLQKPRSEPSEPISSSAGLPDHDDHGGRETHRDRRGAPLHGPAGIPDEHRLRPREPFRDCPLRHEPRLDPPLRRPAPADRDTLRQAPSTRDRSMATAVTRPGDPRPTARCHRARGSTSSDRSAQFVPWWK